MTLLQLTRKLWLIGIIGFLRADDIHCVDVSKTNCTDKALDLFISLPKERRKGKRIEKVAHITANSDTMLCPVATYRSHLERIADSPTTIPHPKDGRLTITPLVHNTYRLTVPVSTQTISNHMDTISILIPEVEKASRRVKPRAISSTLAIGLHWTCPKPSIDWLVGQRSTSLRSHLHKTLDPHHRSAPAVIIACSNKSACHVTLTPEKHGTDQGLVTSSHIHSHSLLSSQPMLEASSNQVESTQGSCHPAGRTNAMALPEIVSNVLIFTDRPTLRACLRVSRLWNACAKPAFWKSHSLTLVQLFNLFKVDNHNMVDKDKSTASSDNTRTQHFIKHCHHIQSLVISDSLNVPPPRSPLTTFQATGLKNLTHIAIQLPLLARAQTSFYRIIGTMISLNTGIRELEWRAGNVMMGRKLIDSILKRTTRQLKKLTIYGDLRVVGFETMAYLIDASERRQEQQPRKQELLNTTQVQPIAKNTADTKSCITTKDVGHGVNDDNKDNGDDGHGCCDLEELVFQDSNVTYLHYGEDAGQKWAWFQESKGILPIQALTLLDHDMDHFVSSDLGNNWNNLLNHSLDSTLMEMLRKCPRLKKLCVGFDITQNFSACSSSTTTTKGFLKQLENHPHYSHEPCSLDRIPERADFVELMHQRCPKLVEIEFGMAYQFTSDHWTEMMTAYGQQLESLGIWGNVLQFNEDAFWAVIGPPVAHPSRNGVPSRLTRLNFNGMKQLCGRLWIVFNQLPFLKEFKARDVPLDARHLIVKDGWICKGLEVLEILITVPLSTRTPMQTTWNWCDNKGCWTTPTEIGTRCRCDGCNKGENHTSHSQEDDEIHGKDNGRSEEKTIPSKRQLEQSTAYASSQKKIRTSGAVISSMKGWDGSINQESEEEPLTDAQRLSIQVCDMIGRLPRLRVLRIEGKRGRGHFKFGWTCLELSLGTGLRNLTPLQKSLETLDVSLLDHGLNRQEEIEWIARNWIHHNNPQWLDQNLSIPIKSWSRTFSSLVSSIGSEESDKEIKGEMGRGYDDKACIGPEPRFRELIGILRCYETNWLQEQCPSLHLL